ASTYIEADVQIGSDTVILPGSILRGQTIIGADCKIGPQADLTDVQLEDEVSIAHSVLVDAVVEANVTIGPFAYVRPGTHIGEGVK
ncbi:bifunctional UDP-N-acetylglucosamine diphosphorylase/glucosamine-1-phosphate N-acetyltransferase GlmU, partial [Microbacteriaceae bacterium K1510]|nr:bifunctional UDP-N-acetylglucosamine diphosphorylase/glucosamine-1-phosphate N-acetyltransferase GlmU [Microbacteriaceae bacterium K1510]